MIWIIFGFRTRFVGISGLNFMSICYIIKRHKSRHPFQIKLPVLVPFWKPLSTN